MNDAGLLLVRIVVGGFMLSHGLPKFRDTDNEYAKSFENLGFRPGSAFVPMAAAVETSSAAMIVAGLFGPVGPMLLSSDMIVAWWSVAARSNTFDPRKHEIETVYTAVAAMLALNGYGRLSLDRAIGISSLYKSWMRYLSLVAAVAGAAFMLALRQPPSPTPP